MLSNKYRLWLHRSNDGPVERLKGAIHDVGSALRDRFVQCKHAKLLHTVGVEKLSFRVGADQRFSVIEIWAFATQPRVIDNASYYRLIPNTRRLTQALTSQ